MVAVVCVCETGDCNRREGEVRARAKSSQVKSSHGKMRK